LSREIKKKHSAAMEEALRRGLIGVLKKRYSIQNYKISLKITGYGGEGN